MTIQTKIHLNTPVTEQELASKTAAIGGARVTDAQVEAFILSEHYFTAGDGVTGAEFNADTPEMVSTAISYDSQLDIMTFCVLVLANGYTVHGISACADPRMFSKEIGQRLARADAKNKIWGLLGFQLRSTIATAAQGTPPSYPEQSTFIGTKVVHSVPMDRKSWCNLRGWDVPADENGDDEGYLVEYADGGGPNVAGFINYVSWSPKDVFERSYGQIGSRA